jgi:hypothetical protein
MRMPGLDENETMKFGISLSARKPLETGRFCRSTEGYAMVSTMSAKQHGTPNVCAPGDIECTVAHVLFA